MAFGSFVTFHLSRVPGQQNKIMNEFPLTGLLCPMFFVAFLIVVVIAIIRIVTKSASGGFRRSGINVPTQLDQDGFWMVSCPADPGSIIYYHYWSGGARYSGQVPFKPEADGRQFIYTGRRPDQVSVDRIVEVGDDGVTPAVIVADSALDLSDPPDTFSDPSPPPSSSSFPSAY
jgi:hypothetical protein